MCTLSDEQVCSIYGVLFLLCKPTHDPGISFSLPDIVPAGDSLPVVDRCGVTREAPEDTCFVHLAPDAHDWD
jgi:hypothetical protein